MGKIEKFGKEFKMVRGLLASKEGRQAIADALDDFARDGGFHPRHGAPIVGDQLIRHMRDCLIFFEKGVWSREEFFRFKAGKVPATKIVELIEYFNAELKETLRAHEACDDAFKKEGEEI